MSDDLSEAETFEELARRTENKRRQWAALARRFFRERNALAEEVDRLKRDLVTCLKESERERGDAHCSVTGNPCGTDTWAKDSHCGCGECKTWLIAHLRVEVERLRGERDHLENQVRHMTPDPPCNVCGEAIGPGGHWCAG